MKEIIIETDRLVLRDWLPSDLDDFINMNADKDVMKYFPTPLSEQESKALFEVIQHAFIDPGFSHFVVEKKSTGEFVGSLGLHLATFNTYFCPCIEIGWRFKKEFWNNGFATEAAKACLTYGFNKHKLNKIYAFTASINIPSMRVMQKIGMQFEGKFDHPHVKTGHSLREHVLYSIAPNQNITE